MTAAWINAMEFRAFERAEWKSVIGAFWPGWPSPQAGMTQEKSRGEMAGHIRAWPETGAIQHRIPYIEYHPFTFVIYFTNLNRLYNN